jgi:hypothetical protein
VEVINPDYDFFNMETANSLAMARRDGPQVWTSVFNPTSFGALIRKLYDIIYVMILLFYII